MGDPQATAPHRGCCDARPTPEAMRGEFVHANRLAALGRSVAMIVHDALQPVASVVTRGQTTLRTLRQDSPDVEAAIASLQRLVDDAQRAGMVLDELRSLAAPIPRPREPLSVNALLRNTLRWLDDELRRNEVALRLDLPRDSVMVVGERVPLHQVFVNLIVNGIEAMSQTLPTRRQLVVGLAVEGQHAFVSFRDSGCGIDATVPPRLFEAFYTTKEEGMGMGLAICKRIVTDHAGSIRAECLPEGGMQFSVRLPCLGEHQAASWADAR